MSKNNLVLDKRIIRADASLLLVAFIWGMSFVTQKNGLEIIGPFSLNAGKFLLGALCLFLVLLFTHKFKKIPLSTIFLGIIIGIIMFLAESFQQFGINFSSVANSGFITSLYVILVPIFGLLIGKKTKKNTFIAAGVALLGLYFITAGPQGLPLINLGNTLLLVSAVFFAVHILAIDGIIQKIDPLLLSFIQTIVAGILCLTASFVNQIYHFAPLTQIEIFDPGFDFQILQNCIFPILYGGICSISIAYTLQIYAQRIAPPAHATIIFSNEAIFAGLGAFFILGETPSSWALTGYVLMLLATLLTQIDTIRKR